MGESKRRPLYAYVDETGNTGHNIFDEAQPDFFTAALITRGDFDNSHTVSVAAIARDAGATALHANELGIGKLESISHRFLALLVRVSARFFVSRVEKRYLLATKMFDSLMDSGENASVAWHHYNVRPLRLMLTFKLAALIDIEVAKLFWNCILEPRYEKVQKALPEVCAGLLRNLDRLPDQRSRKVIGEGLEWARTHPEAIQLHVERRAARQGHFPNMVAFANLLQGLDDFSVRFRQRVACIKHDRQSEFERTLGLWHDMYSTAPDDVLQWAGESHKFQKVIGSTFEVRSDEESAGIQIADTVLWLYKQFRLGKRLPNGCMNILNYVFEHGWESDFSFEGVERALLANYGDKIDAFLSTEQLEEAKRLQKLMEEARQRSMAQYEIDRLPPFMRSPTAIKTK